MALRLVALDEGNDIALDRAMVVVGRHPLCDVRLDSLRISRHHCCMTPESEEVVVRDLGSTNGIRINGERVERGRLRPGDELSIAHIRYRFENGAAQEATLPEQSSARFDGPHAPSALVRALPAQEMGMLDRKLAEVVRNALGVGSDQCRIQVIVQPMKSEVDQERA